MATRNNQVLEMNYGVISRVAAGTLAMLMLASCGGTSDDESGSPTAFATVPTEVTFTGSTPLADENGNPILDPTTGTAALFCSGGSGNVIVVGGAAPYSVNTTFPANIQLSTTSVGSKGGSFTLTVLPGTCLSPGSVVVTDALGNVAIVKVTSAKS
jgi:hypothetical protein